MRQRVVLGAERELLVQTAPFDGEGRKASPGFQQFLLCIVGALFRKERQNDSGSFGTAHHGDGAIEAVLHVRGALHIAMPKRHVRQRPDRSQRGSRIDRIQLQAIQGLRQGRGEFRIQRDLLIAGNLNPDRAQGIGQVTGHGLRHRGSDLFQRLIVRDELQDHLAILLQSFGLAGNARGRFRCGAFLLGLHQHVLLVGDVDHRAGRTNQRSAAGFETPLAAHPAHGAAREHQAKLVLNRAVRRGLPLPRPQTAAIVGMNQGLELRTGELDA